MQKTSVRTLTRAQYKDVSNKVVPSFKEQSLESPENALLSNLCSVDLAWYNKTVDLKETNKDFDKGAFDFRKEKKFAKTFVCQIIAQASFVFSGKKHMIYVYKTNAYNGEVSYYDRVLVEQTTNKWDFVNPYNKKAILYIETPLTEIQKTTILNTIPNNVSLVNSLNELKLILK